jgi:GH24 family phage-related lysozyme (muramidase)
MNIAEYIDWLKKKEGFRPFKYWDVKQFSVGYGTRYEDQMPQPLPEFLANKYLLDRVNMEIFWIDNYSKINKLDLTTAQKIPLIDLRYNAGSWAVGSGLDLALKSKSWQTAKQRFEMYNKANGIVVPALQNRRKELSNLLIPDQKNDNGLNKSLIIPLTIGIIAVSIA